MATRDSTEIGIGKRGRRKRHLIVALTLTSCLGAGYLTWPSIHRLIRDHRAERAILEGRLPEAETTLQVWIDEEPASPRPRLLWAKVARRMGKITEAEEALQRAIELGLTVDEARPEHALIVQEEARYRRE